MSRDDGFVGYLIEALSPLGPVSARPLFGGVGLYLSGTIFGLVSRDVLYLKVGDSNRAEFEAAGAAPFSYQTSQGRHTITSYWNCPPDLLDEPDALRHWVRQAHAVSLAKAKGKKAGSRRRRP